MKKTNGKNKIMIAFGIIIILVGIFIVNYPKLLTTVYTFQNQTGAQINAPQTYGECKEIGGIAIPKAQECGAYFVEFGNSGTESICCMPDTCKGTWERIYNGETKVFEKVCRNV